MRLPCPVAKDVEKRLLAEKKTVTWTLRANNQTVTIPANLGPAYAIDALKEPTVGNTPPVLQFEGAPASGTGPLGAKTSIKAVAGTPVTVKFSVTDDKRALPQKKVIGVRLTWARYRGAGAVDDRRFHQVRRRQRRGERHGHVRRAR